MITTYSFLKTKEAQKLYYFCLPNKWRGKRMENYFIYFPEGYSQEKITTRIDTSNVWEKKVAAMKAHKSQMKDVKSILAFYKKKPKIDHFILQYYRRIKVSLSEDDLFAGVIP